MKAIYLVKYNKESVVETLREYDPIIFVKGNSLKEAKKELESARIDNPHSKLEIIKVIIKSVKVVKSSSREKSEEYGRFLSEE